jgi:hypothetical protein
MLDAVMLLGKAILRAVSSSHWTTVWEVTCALTVKSAPALVAKAVLATPVTVQAAITARVNNFMECSLKTDIVMFVYQTLSSITFFARHVNSYFNHFIFF